MKHLNFAPQAVTTILIELSPLKSTEQKVSIQPLNTSLPHLKVFVWTTSFLADRSLRAKMDSLLFNEVPAPSWDP